MAHPGASDLTVTSWFSSSSLISGADATAGSAVAAVEFRKHDADG